MRTNSSRARAAALALASVVMTAGPAAAQFPDKPVTLVVPFGAGGGFDILARKISEPLARELGVPIVVKNIPGSGGLKGSIDLFRSRPDGYTIGIPHYVPFIGDEFLLGKKPPVDYRQFALIQMIASARHFIYVPKSSPIKSLAELKAHAKEKTPKFAVTGLGSNSWAHVAAFAAAEKFKADYVYGYQSLNAAALGAVRGDSTGGVGGYHQLSGMMDELRPIVYFHTERSPYFKDTPTVTELGYPEFSDLASPYIVSAPPGTPADRLEIIRKAVIKVAQDPDYIKWAETSGYVAFNDGPEKSRTLLQNAEKIYRNLAPYLERPAANKP
jgi:tripartite-type tricarboxylate transporter receptor subunit TctC